VTHPPDFDVIDRYLAGEATPAEIERIHARRAADPAWGQTLDSLASELAAGSHESEWNVDAAWSRLRSKLDSGATPSSVVAGRHSRQPVTPLRNLGRWVAAAAVLVAAAGTIWWTARARGGQSVAATLANEVSTPNGTRHTLTLGDGTRVTLNAASRLRWGTNFGARDRDVWLDGEAYFVVAHDASRPFRVHARNAIAHDLGTRFTVRAYPELPELEVVVAEGSVSLRHDRPLPGDSAVLSAGQLGRIGAEGAPTVEANVRMDRWTAWTNGSLVLEDVTLGNALPQIARWYDAVITVADSGLARKRVTARFHDETLPQMLDALALALGARWERNGRTITLAPVRP
jgi:transmembrane sensor